MTTEQTTGFTPGPWIADTKGGDEAPLCIDIIGPTYDEHLATVWPGETIGRRLGANAALIAAAPDLYEQLLSVYDYYHLSMTPAAFTRRCTELMDDIKAVLMKARGES